MKPMLAVSVALEQVKYPVMVSPKLDGIRCLGTDNGPRSRTLKPIPNKYVRNMLSQKLYSGMDGELIVGPWTANDAMQRTTSGVMSVEGRPEFQWAVFDMWDRPATPFEQRYYSLLELVQQDAWKWLYPVQQDWIETPEELLHLEDEYINAGYEGTILRDPRSKYKYGRSTIKEQYLLKRKPLADAEGLVVGFRYLEHNENEATKDAVGKTVRSNQQANQVIDYERIGAIEVKVLNGPFEGALVSIGTGFTDEDRRMLSQMQFMNSMVGQVVTFTYQASGSKDAPRFPSFKGFRKD